MPEISINFLYQLIGELYIQTRAREEQASHFERELRELRALVEQTCQTENDNAD